MKTNISILLAAAALLFATSVRADSSHGHEKKEAGPNGGRVITNVEPHLEFFVTSGRKVRITFLGGDGKAIAPAAQAVTAICGDRSKPTRMTFANADGSLISDKPLPEGNMIPLVLQVKISPEAKTVTEKFMVNLAECPECSHKEYACMCEH